MDDYLAKPFVQSELLAVLARVSHALHPSPPGDARPLDELAACMNRQSLDKLTSDMAERIEALLEALDEPPPFAAPDALSRMAHELAGTAGTFGLTHLSDIAVRFEQALATDPTETARLVNELHREALAALAELRCLAPTPDIR